MQNFVRQHHAILNWKRCGTRSHDLGPANKKIAFSPKIQVGLHILNCYTDRKQERPVEDVVKPEDETTILQTVL